MMDRDEARAALDAVSQADSRMAERMSWPFQRHAMFGVSEGLIIMGLGIPGAVGISAIGAGIALIPMMIYQDRRRDGMFVSGWTGNSTKPLMYALVAALFASAALSLYLRWEEGTNPVVVLLGIAVAVASTWASLKWEKIYQAELRRGAGS